MIASAEAARNSSLKTEYNVGEVLPPQGFAARVQMFSVSTEIASLIPNNLRDANPPNSFVRNILRTSSPESIF
jgi:hypothetical protein